MGNDEQVRVGWGRREGERMAGRRTNELVLAYYSSSFGNKCIKQHKFRLAKVPSSVFYSLSYIYLYINNSENPWNRRQIYSLSSQRMANSRMQGTSPPLPRYFQSMHFPAHNGVLLDRSRLDRGDWSDLKRQWSSQSFFDKTLTLLVDLM